MSDTPTVTPERLMQMAWAFAPPLMVAAAVQNSVFDSLADGPKSIADLGKVTGSSERGLTALLNGLSALGLLARDGNGRYDLTAESAAFLVRDAPGYLGAFFHHISGQVMQDWLQLPEAVRTGRSPVAVNEEQNGSPFFEKFVEALFGSNYPAARSLAQALEIEQRNESVRVLDLAAGSSVWSIALAQQSPHVTATAVDWPGVLEITRRVVARNGLTERYQFIAGDLLEAEFGSGYDIATLGHILHSEGEERSRRLLKKTHDALKPGGLIAIAEFLVNQDRSGPPNALIFALNMLVHTDKGSTYSFEEISEWLTATGFIDIRSIAAPAPSPLIVAKRG
jgi:ubiquinone/menaquinone biosynthesis C-methylase UbiE